MKGAIKRALLYSVSLKRKKEPLGCAERSVQLLDIEQSEVVLKEPKNATAGGA